MYRLENGFIINLEDQKVQKLPKYQPSGAGGTRSPPAIPAISRMAARGLQSGQRGLERCVPPDCRHSRQFSLNKFFDASTPSMRKGRLYIRQEWFSIQYLNRSLI